MDKGFIFDLDGVIVDTAKYHYIAWKKLAASLGYDFTEKDNEQLKGVSRVKSLEIVLRLAGLSKPEAEKEKLARQKNNYYLELIENVSPDDQIKGSRAFIDEARKKGIKVALGSASKNAELVLKKLGVINLFDARIDGNMVSHAKPDPEVFTKGAEMLGLKPFNCLVFEDAQAGIEAAKNGGMKCVGIGSANVLKGADMTVESLNHITVSEALNVLTN